jgi:hypothetical protein
LTTTPTITNAGLGRSVPVSSTYAKYTARF